MRDPAAWRDRLRGLLAEDPVDTERLLSRLERLSREQGLGMHAALMLLLTRLALPEEDAQREWEAVLHHREDLTRALGRDVGVRVALVDHFVNTTRRTIEPRGLEVELARGLGDDGERLFRAALAAEIHRARRHRRQVALALIGLRCEGGAAMADRAVVEVAHLLRELVRDVDTVARLGPDGLAVLMPGAGRNGALLAAERALAAVGSAVGGLTVSAGIACFPEDAGAADVLMERAGTALYRAQAAGRDTVRTWRPERRRFVRFELQPERFEVEVLAPRRIGPCPARDLSRSGVVFGSPERLDRGDEVEIRLVDRGWRSGAEVRVRGHVARVERRDAAAPNGWEIGVVLDPAGEEHGHLPALLERLAGG